VSRGGCRAFGWRWSVSRVDQAVILPPLLIDERRTCLRVADPSSDRGRTGLDRWGLDKPRPLAGVTVGWLRTMATARGARSLPTRWPSTTSCRSCWQDVLSISRRQGLALLRVDPAQASLPEGFHAFPYEGTLQELDPESGLVTYGTLPGETTHASAAFYDGRWSVALPTQENRQA
jgi:hypothetical protein